MNCSSCGGELTPGAARCATCETPVAPRVDGALAADPKLATPPARPRQRADASGVVSREPAIHRRREQREAQASERSWRDEVQERVRSRREKRVGPDLPLFDQPALSPAQPSPAQLDPPRPRPRSRRESVPFATEQPSAPAVLARVTPAAAAPPAVPPVSESTSEPAAELLLRPAAASQPAERPANLRDLSAGLTDAELADLPLRSAIPPPDADRDFIDDEETVAAESAVSVSVEDDALVVHSDPDDGLELEAPASEPAPLERPARALERTQAAAFDLALFTALSGVAVYFASRSARVEMLALLPAWPWLAAFIGLLAVFYACYFTGTTGQTPGKLLLGLRVVDTSGRRPSYPVATARALFGLTGIALLGLGLLPIAFDPAGRALHDRAFRTRVVRR